MGASLSQEGVSRLAVGIYSEVVLSEGTLPDVGIDGTLWSYSGASSTAMLQQYSTSLIAGMEASKLPGYVVEMTKSLGAFTPVPNAVGLGALVLSIILENVILKKNPEQSGSSMLRRVFGEEKASAIRDSMHEYLKRHRMLIRNEPRLEIDIQNFESKISRELTVLRNSMLYDGQMSSRSLKHWVNGAAFHTLLLVHIARIKDTRSGCRCSVFERSTAYNALNIYLEDLPLLLEKYKSYKISTNSLRKDSTTFRYRSVNCFIVDDELGKTLKINSRWCEYEWSRHDVEAAYIDHMFSHYEQITGLVRFFTDLKRNLDELMNQRGVFYVPNCGLVKMYHRTITCNTK